MPACTNPSKEDIDDEIMTPITRKKGLLARSCNPKSPDKKRQHFEYLLFQYIQTKLCWYSSEDCPHKSHRLGRTEMTY